MVRTGRILHSSLHSAGLGWQECGYEEGSECGRGVPRRRLQMRTTKTLLWLVGLIVLLLGFWLLSTWGKGQAPILPADTSGWLAFVSDRDGPAHIWFLKPDGTEVRAEPDSTSEDLEPTWQQPDGKTLFFVSNRTDRIFQIFHLSPRDGTANQLTVSHSRKAELASDPTGQRILHTAGGTVSVLYLGERHAAQLIPPPTISPGERKALMDAWQAEFGASSFRKVTWGRSAGTLVGVISGDTGDVLIVQQYDLRMREQKPPVVWLRAKRIDVAYHPTEDKFIVAYVGAQAKEPEEADRSWEARETVQPEPEGPTDAMLIVALDNAKLTPVPVFADIGAKSVLISPSWSPDGSRIAAIMARVEGEDLVPESLVVLPAKEGGVRLLTEADTGLCGDPQWSPDGRKLAYTKGPSGKRDIWLYESDREPRQLVGSPGDDFWPRWSPKAGR